MDVPLHDMINISKYVVATFVSLQELHQSANKLIGMLLPWKQLTAVPQAPSVMEIINLVDSVIFEQEREERQVGMMAC